MVPSAPFPPAGIGRPEWTHLHPSFNRSNSISQTEWILRKWSSFLPADGFGHQSGMSQMATLCKLQQGPRAAVVREISFIWGALVSWVCHVASLSFMLDQLWGKYENTGQRKMSLNPCFYAHISNLSLQTKQSLYQAYSTLHSKILTVVLEWTCRPVSLKI